MSMYSKNDVIVSMSDVNLSLFYICTIFIYTLHLYIYYIIFNVEKCRNELGFPKKIPTRFYSLQNRDTPFWYISKIGSGQNLLSRSDFTNSLLIIHFIIFLSTIVIILLSLIDSIISSWLYIYSLIDNLQTIRLFISEILKIETKLWHVDIA
jgi:hypothetical protein